jgi:hypothetical protein
MMTLRNAFQKTINDDWMLIDNYREATLFTLVAFLCTAYFFPLALLAAPVLSLVSFIAQVAFNGFFRATDVDIKPLSHIQTLTDDVTSLENQAKPTQQQIIGMTGTNRDLRQEIETLKAKVATLEEGAIVKENAHQETLTALSQEQAAHEQLKEQMIKAAPYIAQVHQEMLLDSQIRATTDAATQRLGEFATSFGGWLQTNAANLGITAGGEHQNTV